MLRGIEFEQICLHGNIFPQLLLYDHFFLLRGRICAQTLPRMTAFLLRGRISAQYLLCVERDCAPCGFCAQCMRLFKTFYICRSAASSLAQQLIFCSTHARAARQPNTREERVEERLDLKLLKQTMHGAAVRA